MRSVVISGSGNVIGINVIGIIHSKSSNETLQLQQYEVNDAMKSSLDTASDTASEYTASNETRHRINVETRHHKTYQHHDVNETIDSSLNNASSEYSPSRFWASLNLEGEINCGEYKCLFRQKLIHDTQGENVADTQHKQQQQQQIAYLVGNNYPGYQFEAETKASWKLAQYLQSTYQAKHLFLDAPQSVTISPAALNLFQNRTWRRHPKEPMYAASQFATVQQVCLAPTPNVIVTRKWTTFKWFYRKKVTNQNQTIAFLQTLKQDVHIALDVLRAIPLLAIDFQIMIDGEGNIYQFDLDRVFLAGAYYHEASFDTKFGKAYDRGMGFLGRMAAWVSLQLQEQQGHDGTDEEVRHHWKAGDDGENNGEAVLKDHLRNSSSLSCQAFDAVNEMSGRKGKEEMEKTRSAKLMMIQLVQKVMYDNGKGWHDGLETTNDGMWNCTL